MPNRTNTNDSLVSVVMPVYNAQKFLAAAIESIVKQTYKNIELIIVDDGSTDDSPKIIKYYKSKYPSLIKNYRLKKRSNEAGNGAVNAVLKKAKGVYLARMDADDVAHPQRIEKQVRFMENNPEIIVVGTQARVIDENGQVIGKKTNPTSHKDIYQKYAIVHPIVHSSCMIRRSLLPNQNRLYELKGGINDDYYTFFRLLSYGRFANLPEYLTDYRVHGNNISLRHLKKRYKVINNIRKQAVEQFGYQMSWLAKVVIVFQSFLVTILPDNVIDNLYLISRGMNRKNINIIQIIGSFLTLFSRRLNSLF